MKTRLWLLEISTNVTPAVLDIEDVEFRWSGRPAFSLSVPRFSVAQGEKLLLLGESGSGKSTLLSLICGTAAPDTGVISVSGTEISALSPSKRDRFRAENIGVIFQQFNLLPFGTVSDNIILPLRFAPQRRARVLHPAEEAARLCSALGLPPELLKSKACALSVGQQQRVAAVRALIGQPPLIIADEPTSALDAGSQKAFLDVLFEQAFRHGTSVLMVSHDPRLAAHFDRVTDMAEIANVTRNAA